MESKIAFFGASITQQNNGFAKYTTDFLKCESQIFGYGSMHLCDAGICYIDEVLNYKPKYCFIDWFSTGYIKNNKHNLDGIKLYIDTIINKFLKNGVIVIFLFFPDCSNDSITNQPVNKKDINEKLANYLVKLNVPIIDLSEKFNNSELNLILRDDKIHTTDFGSEVYAKHISKVFLDDIYKKYKIPDTFPEKTKYDVVSKLDCEMSIDQFITLKGPCEIIGISQIIGPYSGLLKINNNIINNWDPWCYYERRMIKHNFIINDITTIEVLDDAFDYSACKHEQNWNDKKMLKVKSIFYSGELKILNYK
jgi:hypothetical protein